MLTSIKFSTRILCSTLELFSNSLSPLVSFLLAKGMKIKIGKAKAHLKEKYPFIVNDFSKYIE